LQTLDWRCAFTVEYSSSPVSGFAGLYDRYSMRLFCTAVQFKDKRFPLPVLPLVGNTWYCNKCIKLGGEWRNSVCGLYKSTLIENLAGIQNHLSFK